MNLKIPAKEIWQYIDDKSTIKLSNEPTKHDCHVTEYVTKIDDKYYRFWVEYSYSDGIQMFDEFYDFEEVEPRETVVTTWVKKKQNDILRAIPPAAFPCFPQLVEGSLTKGGHISVIASGSGGKSLFNQQNNK